MSLLSNVEPWETGALCLYNYGKRICKTVLRINSLAAVPGYIQTEGSGIM